MLTFIIENWAEISMKVLALFGALAAVIKIFPQVQEDTKLKKILQFLGKITNKILIKEEI